MFQESFGCNVTHINYSNELQMNSTTPPALSDESKAAIELLRLYLKKAETGEVHGVCITAANNDQTIDCESAGSYEKYPADALGPLEILKLKLLRKALDGPG